MILGPKQSGCLHNLLHENKECVKIKNVSFGVLFNFKNIPRVRTFRKLLINLLESFAFRINNFPFRFNSYSLQRSQKNKADISQF